MPLPAGVPDLASLDLLVTLATSGSIGRAARAHGMTQPSASVRIRELEQRVGLALVERSPSGSRLTADGALLADWARGVLEAAQALAAGVEALRGRRTGKVRVAASLTVAEYLVPVWLVTLRTTHPDASVSLHVANSAEVAEQVRDGRVDVGFVESTAPPRDLAARTVAVDELVVVVGPGHPWARRRAPLAPEELARTPLLLREPGSGTREVLVRALAPFGGPAEPVAVLSSTTSIKAAAASGAGPAVISALAVTDELRSGSLRQVPVTELDLHRRLRAVWARGTRLGGAAADLVALALASGGPPRAADRV